MAESLGRRQFVQGLGSLGMAIASGGEGMGSTDRAVGGRRGASGSALRWPEGKGSPGLDSLHPVIEHSRDVTTHIDKIQEVAGWMAYEELPMPDYQMPFGIGQGSVDDTLDFILTADAVDKAFTQFSSHIKFQVDYA